MTLNPRASYRDRVADHTDAPSTRWVCGDCLGGGARPVALAIHVDTGEGPHLTLTKRSECSRSSTMRRITSWPA